MTAAALVATLLVAVGCEAPPTLTLPSGPAAGSGVATQLIVGLTHTELTADTPEPAANVGPALATLTHIHLQNQMMMGWGTGNPEPSDGSYDWSTLDARIALIRRSGAVPTITLCCAPDWMKGGAPGSTDWNRLDVAPDAAHIAAFATLAAKAAQRYPDVRTFQVWNEMKGFYDPRTNNWDVAGYTTLYNAVYDAVKAVRPDALVGGPYAPMDIWSDPATMSNPSSLSGPWGTVDQRSLDVITYWLAHAHGADFIDVDGRITTRDAGLITDPFTATQVFADITKWIHQRSSLPVWWSELHTSDANPQWSPAQQDAVATVALAKLAAAGGTVALLWQPQAIGDVCGGCLWSDPATAVAQTTPLSLTAGSWGACAPPGARWDIPDSPDPTRLFVAESDQGRYLVNLTPATLRVVDGTTTTDLGPYGVVVEPFASTCSR